MKDEWDQLRLKIVDRILITTVVLAGLLQILSINAEIDRGRTLVAVGYFSLYLMLLLVTFHKRIPYILRASILPIVFFTIGVSELYLYTIVSNAVLYFLGFSILLGILVGFTAGIVALGISLVTIMIFANLYMNGILPSVPIPTFLSLNRPELASDITNWVSIVLPFVFICTAVLVSLTSIVSALRSSIRSSDALIAELKFEMEEHNRVENELAEARRLEAVGQLAGRIAHDVNNFIHIIRGTAELISEEGVSRQVREDSLKTMLATTDRAARLANQLLAASRQQVLNLETVNLNSFLDDILNLIQQAAGEQSLVTYSKGATKAVDADLGMVEQILINLCINARDAMVEGGELQISTRDIRLSQDELIERPWATNTDYVELSVTDNGCGIEPENMDKIFDPFFTTKIVSKGSGLGLASVAGLMKQHKGFVSAESHPGVGTTFRLYFPVGNALDAAVPVAHEQVKNPEDETVLLAEDDPDVLRLAKNYLLEAGYKVLTAADGQEAVIIANEHPEDISVAVLDVMMPGMGGREVRQKLSQSHPLTRVVFTSGFVFGVKDDDFLALKPLVRKPYTRDELVGAVNQAVNQAIP